MNKEIRSALDIPGAPSDVYEEIQHGVPRLVSPFWEYRFRELAKPKTIPEANERLELVRQMSRVLGYGARRLAKIGGMSRNAAAALIKRAEDEIPVSAVGIRPSQTHIDANGRTCTTCSTYKPWSEYRKDSSSRNQHHGRCKQCDSRDRGVA